ncbi:Agglutinin-2 protein [Spatholobus suberectus]|nr:Agglutinin-2 protein [Spatholobus suberectus]
MDFASRNQRCSTTQLIQHHTMTIFNTNLVPTSKPISLFPLLAFTTVFLMLLNRVNSADSLSFSFNEFTVDEEDLILQGDATTGSRDNVLQLTKLDDDGNPGRSSVGRALYYAPVRLRKSSELESGFETTFTFKISSSDPTPGDGLAFFIASPNTTIPPDSAGNMSPLTPSSQSRITCGSDVCSPTSCVQRVTRQRLNTIAFSPRPTAVHQLLSSLDNSSNGSLDTFTGVWSALKPNTDDSEQLTHEMDLLSGHKNGVNYEQLNACSVASKILSMLDIAMSAY